VKIPRHRLAIDKAALRKFLAEPIKAYRPDAPKDTPERWRWLKSEHDKRFEAMFALYDIPADWPEDLQWHQLAMHLAGEAFPGCRTLSRGFGGTTAETQARLAALKQNILASFEAYCRSHPALSDTAAARNFLVKNHGTCEAADLRKPRSFLKAMREAREKIPDTKTGGAGS
jgi:hypothetical protein